MARWSNPLAPATWRIDATPERLEIRLPGLFPVRYVINDDGLTAHRPLREPRRISSDDVTTVEAAARNPDAEVAWHGVVAVGRRGERWVICRCGAASAAQAMAKAIRGRWRITDLPEELRASDPGLEKVRETYRKAWLYIRRHRRLMLVGIVGFFGTLAVGSRFIVADQGLALMVLLPWVLAVWVNAVILRFARCPHCQGDFSWSGAWGAIGGDCRSCGTRLGFIPSSRA